MKPLPPPDKGWLQLPQMEKLRLREVPWLLGSPGLDLQNGKASPLSRGPCSYSASTHMLLALVGRWEAADWGPGMLVRHKFSV